VFEALKWRRAVWGDGYLGSNASAVAAVWKGLLELDPKDPRHDQLRDGLLSFGKPSTGFGDTYSTRRALEALAAYLDKGQSTLPASTLALAGQPALEVDGKRKAATFTTRAETPLAGAVKGGPAGLRASYTYVPAAPGDKVTALRQGFVVTRSASAVAPDGSMEPARDDKSGAVRKVRLGDVLELHATVTTTEARHRVALVVPFAAGLELMNPKLQTTGSLGAPEGSDSLTPTYVQRLDGELRYYFDRLPAGTHSFHFRVRAASEGSFVHPAPFAELMYRQEVRGRGEGMRIVVQGEHEK
ncbi:MAG TPA: hypothetical protein VEB43_12940, partial [Anaeromyxobacter sp.]|nr:hypothetical protein [Anaeromyxobacter sp.]